MKLKKALMGLGSISVIATSTIAITGCGSEEKSNLQKVREEESLSYLVKPLDKNGVDKINNILEESLIDCSGYPRRCTQRGRGLSTDEFATFATYLNLSLRSDEIFNSLHIIDSLTAEEANSLLPGVIDGHFVGYTLYNLIRDIKSIYLSMPDLAKDSD